ncbi:hypothetical protein DICPUDRAFT_81016 [Dictyostelium purpureum]|uniref:SCP domain-containing protein n=1 Tax=Dictyostelium purpureum TaxID=5786 RepID=F0ZS86_DICPU|nr:uncharacterized protein DICPUDRAFT_81016 [Dictyostelium purpureum]EGC33191.1 hypothetical protein DICPUDRAFT_81016 [Dictyostelium purpureum]|eukprot:XP_003290273.1 hypothetical protein DICPUDRAFT_81016 [Dictyostelium purpureum]
MKILYSLLVSFLIFNQFAHIDAYGETVNGYPSSNERETFVLLNMVRMFPQEFKKEYLLPQNRTGMDLIFSKYDATTPLRHDFSLTKVARAHSRDMAVNNCFQHNSCNNENIWDRFKEYEACGGAWGENISAGNNSPLGSMTAFLCDSKNGACVPDGDDNDGHRRNIMSKSYASVGSGYFYNQDSTYRHYYTQDFSSGVCEDTYSPIYSAFYTMVDAKTPRFIAAYSNSTVAFQSVSLVFNGASHTMDIHYGNNNNAILTKDNVEFEFCAPFYFEALDVNKNIVRYPDEGFLRLATNSSCESWSENEIYNASSKLTLSVTLIISLILSIFFI